MAREGQLFQSGVHGLATRIATLFTLEYELCLVSNAAFIPPPPRTVWGNRGDLSQLMGTIL